MRLLFLALILISKSEYTISMDTAATMSTSSATEGLQKMYLSKSVSGSEMYLPASLTAAVICCEDGQIPAIDSDFEDSIGRCPEGWTCYGSAIVESLQDGSFLSTGDGNGYFNIGGSRSPGRGRAVSKPFVLPKHAIGLSFLRCGGANAPSGVTITDVQTSEVLCTATNGENTRWFFKDFCPFQDDLMGGQTVQVEIEDAQQSNGKWGKVFVDKLRIELSSGEAVPIPAPAGTCATNALSHPAASSFCEKSFMSLCPPTQIGARPGCGDLASADRVWTSRSLPLVVLVRVGVECSSPHLQLHPRRQVFSSLVDCASACDKSNGCQFFLYSKSGQCWHELTTSPECPEGFRDDEYDFYMLTSGTETVTVTPSTTDTSTANATRPDLTCPLKVSSGFTVAVTGRTISVTRGISGSKWPSTLSFACTFEWGQPFVGCFAPDNSFNIADSQVLTIAGCDALAMEDHSRYFGLLPSQSSTDTALCFLFSSLPGWQRVEPAECQALRNSDGKRLGSEQRGLRRVAIYEASARPSDFGSNMVAYPGYEGTSCTGTVASWFRDGQLHIRGTLGGLEPSATVTNSSNSLGVHVHAGAKRTSMTALQGITIVVRHDAAPSLVVDFGFFPGSWHPLGEDATHFIGEEYKLHNLPIAFLDDTVYYRGPRTPGLFQITVVTTGVVHVLVSRGVARDQVALSVSSEWRERVLPGMCSDAFPDTEGFRMWTPELQNAQVCIGDHYFNPDRPDPWTHVSYGSTNAQGAVSFETSMSADSLGYSLDSLVGLPIIVHDRLGRRACCSFVRESVVAEIGRYPGYAGPLAVSGTAIVTLEPRELLLSGTLIGLEPRAQVTGRTNSMGIHIHAGKSCTASQVLDHYFDNPPVGMAIDPWLHLRYNTPDTHGVASFSVTVTSDQLGFPLQSVIGRVVVVHDTKGARIGCGILRQGGDTTEVTTNGPTTTTATTAASTTSAPISTSTIITTTTNTRIVPVRTTLSSTSYGDGHGHGNTGSLDNVHRTLIVCFLIWLGDSASMGG